MIKYVLERHPESGYVIKAVVSSISLSWCHRRSKSVAMSQSNCPILPDFGPWETIVSHSFLSESVLSTIEYSRLAFRVTLTVGRCRRWYRRLCTYVSRIYLLYVPVSSIFFPPQRGRTKNIDGLMGCELRP